MILIQVEFHSSLVTQNTERQTDEVWREGVKERIFQRDVICEQPFYNLKIFNTLL